MPVNSTSARRRRKANNRPSKPYPAFPLYVHPSGQCAKKLRNELKYFGAWGAVGMANSHGSLATAGANRSRIIRRRQTIYMPGAHALPSGHRRNDFGDLCNAFLTSKLPEIGPNGIQQRTFNEHKTTTDRLIAEFGVGRLVSDLRPQDIEPLRAKLEKRFGPYRMVNELGRI